MGKVGTSGNRRNVSVAESGRMRGREMKKSLVRQVESSSFGSHYEHVKTFHLYCQSNGKPLEDFRQERAWADLKLSRRERKTLSGWGQWRCRKGDGFENHLDEITNIWQWIGYEE